MVISGLQSHETPMGSKIEAQVEGKYVCNAIYLQF